MRMRMLPPTIVSQEIADAMWDSPIGELRLVDISADNLSRCIFYLGDDLGDFEEEDFISSVMWDGLVDAV